MKKIIFLFPALLCLTGCPPSPAAFADKPVLNDQGQTITFVRQDALHGWITEHKNLKLIALTSYNGGDSGTTGYVVVYETPKVEK
jgi:hypothetical protein